MSAGLGTHIDSPAHCFENAHTVNKTATEFFYNAIIFDFREYCKKEFCISIDQIKEKIKIHDFKIKNKFIIIKTGWESKWGTKEYFNDYLFPHISKEVATYFAQEEIAGIGIDTLSPDYASSEGYYPVHEILLSQNIFIIENIAHLEKINDRLEFEVIIAPLRIISTESPIRLLAIF